MANSSSFFILINTLFCINCCAGQLIITATIQTVQLPAMTVTRLPSPFDENELKLWNVEF